MRKLLISMAFTSLLLGGCSGNAPRQQTGTIPVAGTGALLDGTATDSVTGGAAVEGESVSSQIGSPTDSERRYEYRSGR